MVNVLVAMWWVAAVFGGVAFAISGVGYLPDDPIAAVTMFGAGFGSALTSASVAFVLESVEEMRGK